MSSTNKTTNYNLSQFVGTDVPSYLGDYNSDMSKIDKAIGDVANSQGSVEQSVVGFTADVQGLTTQVSGVSTSVQQLQTSVAQIDSAYKQADTALSQRITANANNIQANTTAIESANTSIESINTSIGTEDISGIGDGTIKGAISNINSSLMNILTPKLIKLEATTEPSSDTFGGNYKLVLIDDSVLANNGIDKNTIVAITPIGAVGDNGYSAIVSPYNSSDVTLKNYSWVLNSSKAMKYTLGFIAWCKES